LARLLPQAKIVLEYRHDSHAIPYTNRTEYATCFFKTADRLWADINLRNDKIDISDGLYLLNLPLYNEEVVREAVNNAIAHRDYRCQSEIFVLQSPELLIVKNAGGFPRGVTLGNLLSVCSTPRNRLLADVLAKTGVVERSGQGIDKIFKNTLSEGKKMPDYGHSDDFGVELHLSSEIEDVAFALFLEAMQKELPEEQRLSVFEIVALNQIREGHHTNLPTDTLQSLLKKGMIEKRGRTKGTHYVLSKTYYEYSGNEGQYSKESSWNKKQAMVCILGHFEHFKHAKMKDFVAVLESHMTRRQIRMMVDQLVEQHILLRSGKRAAAQYEVHPDYKLQQQMQEQALEIGMAALQNQDEHGKDTTETFTDNAL
jgi:divergent AAA domain protein